MAENIETPGTTDQSQGVQTSAGGNAASKISSMLKGLQNFNVADFVKGKPGQWQKMAVVAVVVIIVMGLGAVMMWGLALWALANSFGEPNGSYASSSGECYMPDQYWRDPSPELTIETIKQRVESYRNISNENKDRNLQKLLDETRGQGYNPAVALAVWGKESTYGTNPRNRRDPRTNLPYEFGYLHEGTGGFDGQLRGTISTLDKAYKGEDPYPRKPGVPIQVNWLEIYTPSNVAANAEDKKTFFTIVKQAVPNQVVCSTGGTGDKEGPFIQNIQQNWLAKTHRFNEDMVVKGIVLHYTAGGNVEGAISAMTSRETYVHLIIGKDGSVYKLLPFNKRVKSGSGDGNSFAVGIEIVGMNESELLRNDTQYRAVIETCKWLIANYKIPNIRGNTDNLNARQGIFGHYQTQGPWGNSQRGCNSPNKIDPGKNYMKKVWDTLGSTGQGC